MPYWRLFYNMTWSTKGRMPSMVDATEADLYRVMVGKAQDLGAHVFAIGGTSNHVHLAVSVPPAISLAGFIGQVKGISSHAMNQRLLDDNRFHWQAEYGVVSFGGKQPDMIVNYVLEQRAHHQNSTILPFPERLAPPSAASHSLPPDHQP